MQHAENSIHQLSGYDDMMKLFRSQMYGSFVLQIVEHHTHHHIKFGISFIIWNLNGGKTAMKRYYAIILSSFIASPA